MVNVTLTEAIRIGRITYWSIDTKKFPPKVLKRIVTQIKDNDTKYIIIKAIFDGDYKKNKNTIYLVPPIFITTPPKLLTHILFDKETYDNLKNIRKMVVDTTLNNVIAIEQLTKIIKKKKPVLTYDLPIKKRKII